MQAIVARYSLPTRNHNTSLPAIHSMSSRTGSDMVNFYSAALLAFGVIIFHYGLLYSNLDLVIELAYAFVSALGGVFGAYHTHC